MKMNNVLRKCGIGLLVLLFVSALSSESSAQEPGIVFGREILKPAPKAPAPIVVTFVHVKGHEQAADEALNRSEMKIPFNFNENLQVVSDDLESSTSEYDVASGSSVGGDGLSFTGMSLKLSGTGTMSLSPNGIYSAYYPNTDGGSTGSPEYLDNLCKDHWRSPLMLPLKNGFAKGTLQIGEKKADYRIPTVIQLQLKIDCRMQ